MQMRQEAADLQSQEWQMIATQLTALAKGQTEMAISVERLSGRVEALDMRMGGQIAGLDQRLKTQEAQPSNTRDSLNAAGVVAAAVVALFIGAGTIGCSGLSLLVSLYKLVHP